MTLRKIEPVSVGTFQPAVITGQVKGRVDRTASTATSYCWLVFERSAQNSSTRLVWIPPCRSKLERQGDYK